MPPACRQASASKAELAGLFAFPPRSSSKKNKAPYLCVSMESASKPSSIRTKASLPSSNNSWAFLSMFSAIHKFALTPAKMWKPESRRVAMSTIDSTREMSIDSVRDAKGNMFNSLVG